MPADIVATIERMFRRYEANKALRRRLKRRLAPKSRSVMVLDGGTGGGHGETWEDVICELTDVEAELDDCRLCLALLTRQERSYVEARYFWGLTYRETARQLGLSVREVFRVRQSVICKSAVALGYVDLKQSVSRNRCEQAS